MCPYPEKDADPLPQCCSGRTRRPQTAWLLCLATHRLLFPIAASADKDDPCYACFC